VVSCPVTLPLTHSHSERAIDGRTSWEFLPLQFCEIEVESFEIGVGDRVLRPVRPSIRYVQTRKAIEYDYEPIREFDLRRRLHAPDTANQECRFVIFMSFSPFTALIFDGNSIRAAEGGLSLRSPMTRAAIRDYGFVRFAGEDLNDSRVHTGSDHVITI
jgi:hypothetical protein